MAQQITVFAMQVRQSKGKPRSHVKSKIWKHASVPLHFHGQIRYRESRIIYKIKEYITQKKKQKRSVSIRWK